MVRKILSKRVIAAFSLVLLSNGLFSSLPALAEPSGGDLGREQAQLAQLEKRLFDHSYTDESVTDRLDRLDKFVFGETKSNGDSERLAQLNTAITAKDKHLITDGSNQPRTAANTPSAPASPLARASRSVSAPASPLASARASRSVSAPASPLASAPASRSASAPASAPRSQRNNPTTAFEPDLVPFSEPTSAPDRSLGSPYNSSAPESTGLGAPRYVPAPGQRRRTAYSPQSNEHNTGFQPTPSNSPYNSGDDWVDEHNAYNGPTAGNPSRYPGYRPVSAGDQPWKSAYGDVDNAPPATGPRSGYASSQYNNHPALRNAAKAAVAVGAVAGLAALVIFATRH